MYTLLTSAKDLCIGGILLLLLCAPFETMNGQTDECLTSPVISCPSIYFGCTADDLSPEAIGFATAVPGDANCPQPIVTYRDTTISQDLCGNGTEIKRFWKATYPDNTNPWLFAECTQIIILRDSQSPIITDCPSDMVVQTDISCRAIVRWDEPNASDDCGLLSFTTNFGSGTAFEIGVTTVTYTAVDNCGNRSTCSFTVTVEENCCNDSPTITAPNDYEGCPNQSLEPSITGMPTGIIPGSGCGDPVFTYVDETTGTGDCEGERTIRRTWTATNPNHDGLSVSAVQWITLEDNTTPSISNCPTDITIVANSNCMAIVDWLEPTANDNCGIISFMNDRPTGSGSQFPIGTTTITYTAIDVCGNTAQCSFDVTVIGSCCNDPMVLSCPADFNACPGTSSDPSATGTATVTSSSDCPATVTYFDVTSSVNGCADGTRIERHWVATRNDGMESDTCIQVITLADTEAPIITQCLASVTLPFDRRQYSWGEPGVTDNCDVSITYSHPRGTIFPVGTTEVVLEVVDGCGNVDRCTFTVTVQEENVGSGLVVTCPDDLSIGCGGHHSGSVPRPEVTTDCELCQEGNIPGFVYMGERDGHKYYCSREKMTWPDAQAFCVANGGTLAIINSAAENQFLARILDASSAYIGLSDADEEGNFKWVDGSTPSYTKWYPRQPNDYKGSQDYVEMLRSGYWNDQYNNKPLEFIMEVSCINIEQTSGPVNLADARDGDVVSYSISDACGNTEACSYQISLSSEVSLSCNQDIERTVTGDNAVVYFETPELTSCCTQCDGGDPIDGFFFMGERNGSYYYCSTSKMTWHEANAFTRANGGNLAIVEDEDENDFLANILKNTIAFIGITDHEEEGVWKTVNGDVQNYFNWRSDGNPNNYEGVQHYVEMEPSGKWNDNSGTYKREFIMELKGCGRVRQTSGLPSGAVFPSGRTTVTYQATDACGNSRTCSFDVVVNREQSTQVAYCDSKGASSSRMWINKVEVDNYSFTTGNNGGYYENLSDCITLNPGAKFKLRVTPGFARYRYYGYYHIYVDYNGDGDFNDHKEYVGKAKSANVISGELWVPENAVAGTTKMRIVMSLTGYPTACGAYYYGETEDYCVEIGNSAPSEAPKTSKGKSVNDEEVLFESIPLSLPYAPPLVYPNPTTDFFKIDIVEDIAELTIYDINGKIVKQFYQPQTSVDVSDLNSGIYLVRMIDHVGLEITEKIVVE